MKKTSRMERGQALVLITLAAVGLFGVVGLAIDGSAKLSDRRHAQNAADAAALAGAFFKANSPTNDICTTADLASNSTICLDLINVAWDRALSNGYDGLLSNDVEVYSPPISGPYLGNSNYVQVIITSRVNTTFGRVVGIQETKNTVDAVAFTAEGGYLGNGAMLLSYDPDPGCSSGLGSGGGSFDVSGNSTVELTGGGIFLNSDESCGFAIPNCANLVFHTPGTGINTAGGDNIDQEGCTVQAPEYLNQDPVAIPEDVYWPDVPAECGIAPTADYLGIDPIDGKGEWLIHPGYYEQFPQGVLVANKQHIYMASGVYCIDPGGASHDFDLSWSPVDFVSLNGSTDPLENKYHVYNPDGVTLYIKSGGGFTLNSNNPTYLDGATEGDYQGYLMILEGQHTSIEDCSISGGAGLDINGVIFAPYCDITVNGGSSALAQINAQLLGWTLKVDGSTNINFTFDPKYQIIIRRRVGLMD